MSLLLVADLGPPNKVDLSPAGSDLDVFISDPVTSTNISMKENHPELYYHVVYWERSAGQQVGNSDPQRPHFTPTLPQQISLISIDTLTDPHTCFSVQCLS